MTAERPPSSAAVAGHPVTAPPRAALDDPSPSVRATHRSARTPRRARRRGRDGARRPVARRALPSLRGGSHDARATGRRHCGGTASGRRPSWRRWRRGPAGSVSRPSRGSCSASPSSPADHADALVREAAVAALGSIGDAAGLPAILVGHLRQGNRAAPRRDRARAVRRPGGRRCAGPCSGGPRLAGAPGRRGPELARRAHEHDLEAVVGLDAATGAEHHALERRVDEVHGHVGRSWRCADRAPRASRRHRRASRRARSGPAPAPAESYPGRRRRSRRSPRSARRSPRAPLRATG